MHHCPGRIDSYQLQMIQLSLRNDRLRLKFETSGELPIGLEESIEYTSNGSSKTERYQHATCWIQIHQDLELAMSKNFPGTGMHNLVVSVFVDQVKLHISDKASLLFQIVIFATVVMSVCQAAHDYRKSAIYLKQVTYGLLESWYEKIKEQMHIKEVMSSRPALAFLVQSSVA